MLPGRRIWAGAAICAMIGLATTAHPVFSPRVLAHYADSPDSVNIAESAEAATPRDLLRWWTGSWIQRGSTYYRPLSSILFWLEHRAFGRNFQGYVVVSWLVHGWVCASLFLLGFSVFPGSVVQRSTTAILAVALFSVRLGPQGPTWAPAPVSYAVVAWWPAQTDQVSLAFSVWALLLFDGWLKGSRHRGLLQGTALWIVALLFKEMAVSLPVVAGCLIMYRRGLRSMRLWAAEDAAQGRRRLSPGVFWQVVLPGLLVGAGFLVLRSILVPGAWGPQAESLHYFLRKVLFYAGERPATLVASRGLPLVVIPAFLAACIYVYARLPRRPSAVWLALTVVICTGALAQVLTGSFALITIPDELAAIGTVTLLILGVVVLAHVRTGPAWMLLGSVVAIHLPILHVWGPHYFYWPAAFWALLNASLLLYVWQRWRGGTLQWRKQKAGGMAASQIVMT